MSSEENRQGMFIDGLVDTFCHTLDDKKRLTIPREWRDALGWRGDDSGTDYIYVFPNETEDCLDLVPVAEVRKIVAEISSGDILSNNPVATAIARNAQMLKIDKAGRIRIGDALLAFAGIKGRNGEEVTLEGSFNKAHVWAGRKRPKSGGIDVAAFRAALAGRKAAKAAAETGDVRR